MPQRFLRGRIVFTPTENGTGYTLEAETCFDRLFSGIAVPVPEYVKIPGRGRSKPLE